MRKQVAHVAFYWTSIAIVILAFGGIAARGRTTSRPHSSSPEQTTAKPGPSAIIFWEDGFPAADTAQPTRDQLAALLPAAGFTPLAQLGDALAAPETRLLVLPYGSAFPEAAWPNISKFLYRGGNLLVLGGRPFTRAAYLDNNAWHLRAPHQAFARSLFLNDYAETPGSDSLKFLTNSQFQFLNLPTFDWKRAWSVTARLTDESLYPRQGSAGTLDTRFDTLAWGVSDSSHRLAAPLVELDHVANHFAGGRWILLNAELSPGFWASPAARQLVPLLARRAADGAEDFTVQPSWPLFLPGEPLTFAVHWLRFTGAPSPIRLELNVTPEQGAASTTSWNLTPGTFPFTTQISLPASTGHGLHSVTAKLYEGPTLRAIYRTGFWLRDEDYLHSGPRLGVSGEDFTLDGKPILVVGTTYMASDVQRQFFMRPNPWLWDQDMAEIQAAGLNTIRTGWWTAWDQVMKQSGTVREDMLRALEAYLMTARRHGLAVQFTFFAFSPDVLGGSNPYLDPEAVRRQEELILSFVERFRDVPFLTWDLINEPSFSNPEKLWYTRPNGDRFELKAWNDWLEKHYASRGALAEAWRSVPVPEDQPVPLPTEPEFSSRAAYEDWPANNSLRAMDYQRFAQDAYRGWVKELRDAIRATGSEQLITADQDEGGGTDRPSPAYFGDVVDFTTTHTWWMSDAVLWDSLVATLPGEPMVVQETGVAQEFTLSGEDHRGPAGDAALIERKLAIAAGTSGGAIEWLWNINAEMLEDREATIGALRADGTEKTEAEILRRLARFAAAAGPHLGGGVPPDVTIIAAKTAQYSPIGNLALEAQQKAVRAIHYGCGVAASVLPENQIARLGQPKLVIVPSAHALSDEAWNALLAYAANGGTFLLTGSFERDAHWKATNRLAQLGSPVVPVPLLLRTATQQVGNDTLALSFGFDKQEEAEALHFANGGTFAVIPHGKGRIFAAAEPIELADGLSPTVALYSWALAQTGVKPLFDGAIPQGVLIRPVVLADSVLYLIVSESADDAPVDLHDRGTGAAIHFTLLAGRARVLLFSKTGGQLLASFGE
ncbi:MAG: hypothetical protein ACLP1Y_11500 [Candidatus Acidiferrales bacterium]